MIENKKELKRRHVSYTDTMAFFSFIVLIDMPFWRNANVT